MKSDDHTVVRVRINSLCWETTLNEKLSDSESQKLAQLLSEELDRLGPDELQRRLENNPAWRSK